MLRVETEYNNPNRTMCSLSPHFAPSLSTGVSQARLCNSSCLPALLSLLAYDSARSIFPSSSSRLRAVEDAR